MQYIYIYIFIFFHAYDQDFVVMPRREPWRRPRRFDRKIKLKWKGKGLNEKAYNKYNKPIVECDKNYFRPLDVNTLLGNSSKAKKELKWKPKININMLIDEMIENELKHIFK